MLSSRTKLEPVSALVYGGCGLASCFRLANKWDGHWSTGLNFRSISSRLAQNWFAETGGWLIHMIQELHPCPRLAFLRPAGGWNAFFNTNLVQKNNRFWNKCMLSHSHYLTLPLSQRRMPESCSKQQPHCSCSTAIQTRPAPTHRGPP